MPQGTDQSHAVGGSKGKPLLETSLPNQPSNSQPVPVGAQESLPKGVEDSVPNKVHDTGIFLKHFLCRCNVPNLRGRQHRKQEPCHRPFQGPPGHPG